MGMTGKWRWRKLIGGILLLLSMALAFLWFYWLAPLRHLNSVTWQLDHSPRRQWDEMQKQIRRTGLDHDNSIGVGSWGGKEWMEWVIVKIKAGEDIYGGGGCGGPYGHLADAPAQITNHRFANHADWISWWSTNQHRSQLEWIREGFGVYGIDLQESLTTNNIVALLKAISSGPYYIKYNSLRWLRDSGIRPQNIDLGSLPKEDGSALRGLITYATWYGEHENDPGRLPIGGRDWDFDSTRHDPPITKSKVRCVIYLIMALLAGSGLWLLRKSPVPR